MFLVHHHIVQLIFCLSFGSSVSTDMRLICAKREAECTQNDLPL
jgi:hypothetical protein